MPMIPALINFTILSLVSAIHIYWGFGGSWGLRESLPERNGSKAFHPGRIMTLVVAFVFGGMALFYLFKIGWLSLPAWLASSWVQQYGLWLLAGIFLLRAVGDFRYVGFFKRVRNSRFAHLDTRFYSPLCLLLCINTSLLILFPSRP